jgi:hypothetical protein
MMCGRLLLSGARRSRARLRRSAVSLIRNPNFRFPPIQLFPAMP